MKLSPLDKTNFFVLFTLYLIKIRNYWPEWKGNGFILQVKIEITYIIQVQLLTMEKCLQLIFDLQTTNVVEFDLRRK